MGGNICLYLCSVCCLIACWIGQLNGQSVCQQLQPSPVLQKFVDPLPIPANIDLSKSSTLTMGAYKISQSLHRDLPNTTVYAFGTTAASATYPGPTLTARRGVAARISWQNQITDSEHLLVVDKTLNWANPANGGVPMVVHLHGGEVPSTSDGHPNAWFTASGDKGPTWSSQNYYYPNTQFPAMLWYHDHTIGITRLNVYAGLVGLYFITSNDEANDNLPTGNFHLPLVIQDKQFYANGSLNFPNVGSTPNSHPNWCPEFFGDTILVNGKAWPYLTVQARRYRFRMLNGANARFFSLSFNSSALYFIKIGTDGGFLSKPLNQTTLTFSPGERVDVIVDFSSISPGSDIILQNSAPAPFPGGSAPSSDTAVVMKFHVVAASNRSRTPFSVPKIFGPATIQPAQAGPAATEPEVAQAGPAATGPAATEPEHAQAGPAATEPEHAQAGPAATAQKKRARLPPGLVGKLYVTSDEVIRARLEHQQQIEEAARIRKEKMEEKKVLQEKRKAAKEIELKRKEEARIARQQKKKVHSTVKKAKRKRVVIEDSSDDEEVMVIELARERAKTRRGCASTSNGLQLEVNIPIQVEDQDATSMQVENQSNVNILQDSQDHNDQDTCIGCSIEDTHICSWDEHCRNRKQNDEEQEEFGSPAEYWTEPDGYHGRDNVNSGDSQETNSEDSRRKTKALDEVYRKEADDHLRKYGL